MNSSIKMPVQLMWLNVGQIRRYIDKFAGDKRYAQRSLYPYFFSAKEEQGIYGRLAGLPEQGRSLQQISAMSVAAPSGEQIPAT
jgi:hypothetical protein